MLPMCKVILKHTTVTGLIKECLRLKNLTVHYCVHKSIGEPAQPSMLSIKSKQYCILKRKWWLIYSRYATSLTELKGSLP